jgi:Rps23 Pro-64 3,4-dihydroxylase Tpa1-like proline 4-hydroxylase
LYLNAPWDIDRDGGALHLFPGADPDDGTGASCPCGVVAVAPTGGTLVLFDSKTILHAVEPTSRRRLALTAWISGDRKPE